MQSIERKAMHCQAVHFVHWRRAFIFLFLSLATVAGKPGFLLTTHNTAIPGSKHKVCITFAGVTSEIAVEYEFRRPQDSFFSNIYAAGQAVLSASGGCKEFALPVSLPAGLLELLVNGYSTNDETDRYSFSGTTTLKVFTRVPDFTLIQTDKPVYKPGQTVRFRLVTLMFNLSVVTTGVLNVSIKNPDDIDIERWTSISRSKGIVELSVKLAEEPRLGTYMIYCDVGGRIERKNFTVLHYDLPRVEVLHKPAEYFVRDSEALTGQVCARYTFSGGINLPALKGGLTVRFVVVKVGNDSRVTEKTGQTFTLKDEINGCYTYNIPAQNLNIDWLSPAIKDHSLLVSVTVEEHGPGIQTTANDAIVKLEIESATVKIIGGDTYKPGLPYIFKVKLTFRDGQSHSDRKIRVTIPDGFAQGFRSTEMTDGDGFAYFTATPVSLFQELTIEAALMEETSSRAIATDTKQVTSWYSPSGRYIKIRQPNDGNALSCNREETIDFDYTTITGGEAVSLHFQVIGNSNILLSKTEDKVFLPLTNNSQPPVLLFAESCLMDVNVSITTRRYRGSDSIKIRTVPEMYPSAKLLVFYIATDGEIVADWADIPVKECTRNSVKLMFSTRIVRPGKSLSLDITAAAGSYCTYGVIDRSVDLLSTGKLLDLAEVVKTAQARLPTNDYWQSKLNDYMKHKLKCQQALPLGLLNTMNLINVNDSSLAFLMGTVAVATDFQMDTRRCFCSINVVSSRGLRQHSPIDWENELSSDGITYEPSVLIREYFPETWLWDGFEISKSGRNSTTVNAPHSLTSWRGKAMCVHKDLGFGISPVSLLTTFQRFFMRVSFPYPVIRGESVPVVVKIHNYYTDCFTIIVAIEESNRYEIVRGVTAQCVCGAHPQLVIFRIIPRSLGSVNVTITAREVNLDEETNVCPPTANMSIIVGIRDTVVATIVVEPEGKKEEHVQSAYICGRSGESPRKWTLNMELKDGIVADSARGLISVVGDLLGVTVANIKNLIILPQGCGEQSMSAFAPISFAARYLEYTGQLTESLANNVTEFLKTGYQKQLTVRKDDGSFGYYPHSRRSLWLTAFIVKCFTHASRYLSIANDTIMSSIKYIQQNQLPNGCFSSDEAGVYTKFAPALDPASKEKLQIRVTAFVVIAMLEAGVSPQNATVVKALECLDSAPTADTYGLAMIAYAYSLHDIQSQRRQIAMKELMQKAISVGSNIFGTSGSTKYWIADPSQSVNAPINIETTAYALLAILAQPGQTYSALPVVNWLTLRQNSRGAYESTQDTVISIQALAAYAQATYSTIVHTGVVVNASFFEFSRSFEVSTRNRLVVQSAELSKLRPGNLTFAVAGGGCVVVQAKTIYNVMIEGTANTYFQTLVKSYAYETAQNKDNCTQRLLQICTRYTGDQDNSSSMAIIDVKMISGWVPDTASLDAQLENKTLHLEHYELKNQLLSLHFSKIIREYRCLTIEITRMHHVRNAKPGQVFTYEYYANARRHETTFTMEECEEMDEVPDPQDMQPECPLDDEECLGSRLDMDICPSCAQPIRLSKLCQYKHVLKVRRRTVATPRNAMTIVDDLKTTNSYLKQRPATLLIDVDSCLCETLEIQDNAPFIIALPSDIKERPLTIHASSKDVYIFPTSRDKEEKIAQALQRCNATK